MSRNINRFCIAVCALSFIACGEDSSTKAAASDLDEALSTLENDAEQEAMRGHGMADERVAEAGEDGERLGAEGEEAPAPGARIDAFCAERAEAMLARCEAEAENPDEVCTPENAARRCQRRAIRHVQRRIRACHQACRGEAHEVMDLCVDEGGERDVCREDAIGAAQGCHEACPDRPEGERPEGERPEGERPEGERPEGERPEGERPEGERPEGERPEGERPEGERPEGERPEGERPAPDGDEDA